MDSLQASQAALFKALTESGASGCLLKVCAAPEALWVCDLPRRGGDTPRTHSILSAHQVIVLPESQNGLWLLDWSPERYQGLAARLPRCAPAFPNSDALHPAYALCRLLLSHPFPLESQPLGPSREVMKLEGRPPEQWNARLPRLHGQCAALLRQKAPLPTLAGGLLARLIENTQRGGSL